MLAFGKSDPRLSLQAKVTGVILIVLVAVFSLIPFAIHQFVKPLLLDEAKRIGVSTGTTLVDEIVDQHMFARSNAAEAVETRLRELLYLQTNVRRMEVFRYDSERDLNVLLASSIEEETPQQLDLPVQTEMSAQLSLNHADKTEDGWEILIPVPGRTTSPKVARRPIGLVKVVMSVAFVSRTVNLLTRVSIAAAFLGALLLTSLLSFALRRTIENDRKLREAESENLVLSRQLQETEKRLMNLEKLAVMGQLTANFAHEIGTPLNAIGGHLSLLKEEVGKDSSERIAILEGQVAKIAKVVRSFLQNTAKPSSQRQLVDPHRVMETTLQIVRPQTDLMKVSVRKAFDRGIGPIRMVPVELEQVLLNLVNNSLDSMKEKAARDAGYRPEIDLATAVTKPNGRPMLEIVVRDNGTGIEEKDLGEIQKPFFTTKAPGEGTGLGLSICRDILKRYEGRLEFRSRIGEWTEARVQIPFRNEAENA